MVPTRVIIFSLCLLACISCGDNTRKDKNIDLDNTQTMQSDTADCNTGSDYQNQSGSRTNSDTINQSGKRPDDLK